MKTAISVADETFARVEAAAARLGVSRSEFFARAAERWLDELSDDGLTDRINDALAIAGDDDENAEFRIAANKRRVASDPW